MKVIIDIDDNVYEWVMNTGTFGIYRFNMAKAIKNGIPLDEVKAEIEKLNPVDYGSMFSYESHNGARDMQRDILDIINNIGECKNDKKVN